MEATGVFHPNLVVFFFQAEDGIRDYKVTGVQTCALPIYRHGGQHRESQRPRVTGAIAFLPRGGGKSADQCAQESGDRSEERRVGKECRHRWSARHRILRYMVTK